MLPEPILKLYETWVDTYPVIHNMEENKTFVGLYHIYFFTKVVILWI